MQAHSSQSTHVPPIDSEATRLRRLLQAGDFNEALQVGESLLERVPENRDVLYMVAVSLRNLRRTETALSCLTRLQATHSKFSRLYQEKGYCYVALHDAPKAIEAFLTAVNINPALPASWRMLQNLFQMTDQRENADMARRHIATLEKLPPEVVSATDLFSDGEMEAAERIIRPFLLKHGNHVEGMRLLARIGLELDVLDDAELLLKAVLELEPSYRAARLDYARALLKRHKHTAAMKELDTLLELDPGNRTYLTAYAAACVGIGDHERALTLFENLLDEPQTAADIHLSIAHSIKTLGRTQEAIAAYKLSLGARATFGDAYWSLANLKTYRFSDHEISQMLADESSPNIRSDDRYRLCFALGKALEDRGQYEESFSYYKRGNDIKKAESRFRIELVERQAELQKVICTRKFFDARATYGFPSPDPIFILGLPRAGSTLLEQILASHSLVEGTMELADVPRIVQALSGREDDQDNPRYPAILETMQAEELYALGERYISDTRVYRSGRPFFVDKMPNNFRHIGLIHLMLPGAKIIDARREPMACCFSNFKQLFATGQEFTYSMEDIARYYRSYVSLMDHWESVLPGKILRVQYEDLVNNFESNVRRVLAYCGLPFEKSCVQFHLTRRSVRTASSEQVRRPLNRDGMEQWKNFEPYLGELKATLGNI